ncbi:unnamed protein product [Cyclocybe aegerita]|uniref:Uncharacterized protein n=1 Tax=Cyclocybe aegerita TaxID=1973307 RepID=A0A8S0W649_CYCAE|nr:unnamed protein product [Cyclocybe aegerita]
MAHHNDNSCASSEAARVAAATLIQRMWRGKNHNLAKDEYLNPESRWDDALNHAKLAVNRNGALDGRNSPRRRWIRATYFIGQLRDKNKMLKEEGVEVDVEDKHLETQHWLELIDSKHRYGSNLKWYHKKWQGENTTDNFFKWLDHGGGKDVSFDECPRERLEKERILYLSAEQRAYYSRFHFNDDGKLLWAKNNLPVDTTAGHWKDTGDGQGIVPQDMPSKPASATTNSEPFTSATLSDSKDQDNAATHYAGQPTEKHGLSRYWRRYFTLRGMMERLLRKTVKRNTCR